MTLPRQGLAPVPVTDCPITPVAGVSFSPPPVPAATALPQTVSFPPAVSVFGTGNQGWPVIFSLAPAGFTCTAIGGGADGGFAINVRDPAARQHSIGYDYNPGGAGPNADLACPYIPAAKAAETALRVAVQGCTGPAGDVVTQVATGARDIYAAVVRVPPAVKDPNLPASGDRSDVTVAVFIAQVSGASGVSAQEADCTLPGRQRDAVCLAALELFVTQSIAVKESPAIFAALTAALPQAATSAPAVPPAGVPGSWSISPRTGLAAGIALAVGGSGCVAAGVAPSDLEVSVQSQFGELAYFSVADATGRWGAGFHAPHAPPSGRTMTFHATCENDHGVLANVSATPVFTYRQAITVSYGASAGGAALRRPALIQALPGRGQVPFTLPAVLKSLGVVVLLVMLAGFPAEIFNRTLETNYAEVQGWFRRLGRLRPPDRLTGRLRLPPAAQFTAFCLVAAVLSALVDPEVAFRAPGWAVKGGLLMAGFAAAIPVTTLVYAGPGERYARQVGGGRARLRVLPLALLIAAAFVAISLAGHLVPGYVYGLIAGYGAAKGRKLDREYEGRTVLLGACAVLAVSLLAWVAWEPVRAAAAGPHPSWPILILDAVMSLAVILGLEAIVFGLLPMKFLDGGKLRAWNPWAWAAVYGTAAFFFVHLLVLNTVPVTQAQRTHAIVTVFTLYAAFALFSCAFWAYFRYRPAAPTEAADAQGTGTPDAAPATGQEPPPDQPATPSTRAGDGSPAERAVAPSPVTADAEQMDAEPTDHTGQQGEHPAKGA